MGDSDAPLRREGHEAIQDNRNLVSTMYVGTNATGATETDPTGGGAAGNNMVLVTQK